VRDELHAVCAAALIAEHARAEGGGGDARGGGGGGGRGSGGDPAARAADDGGDELPLQLIVTGHSQVEVASRVEMASLKHYE